MLTLAFLKLDKILYIYEDHIVIYFISHFFSQNKLNIYNFNIIVIKNCTLKLF